MGVILNTLKANTEKINHFHFVHPFLVGIPEKMTFDITRKSCSVMCIPCTLKIMQNLKCFRQFTFPFILKAPYYLNFNKKKRIARQNYSLLIFCII